MSFTTRCPACGTMFRVVPDQLKISDGWVRCGHCSDVFDAMLNLQNEASQAAARAPVVAPPQAPSPARVIVRKVPAPAAAYDPPSKPPSRPSIIQRAAPVPSPPPPSPRPPAPKPVAAPKPVDPGWDFVSEFEALEREGPDSDPGANDAWDGDWLLSPQTISLHRDAVQKEMSQQSPPTTLAPPAAAKTDIGKDFERELAEFNASGWDGGGATKAPNLGKTTTARAPASSSETDGDLGDSDFEPAGHVPAFVVQGRRDAFWRTPAMRSALLALACLLSVLLAAQWALHDRDELSARYPAMAPALQALCSVTGCAVVAPRRIEAVAIDSSTLVRKLGQFYAFDLVVKNSAAMAVAMPALELSLTDVRDKEIARRVFLPKDMPGQPTLVPAKGTLSVNMRLSLSETELSNMAGYRALVFYP